MKDTKFIELLNLYVDQQIDPADAALLEEEILRNPARRRTYQQYCRMHRACALLQEQSRPSAEAGEKFCAAVAAADEQVVEFPAPQPKFAKRMYFGGLAAAACVAFVFVTQTWKSQVAVVKVAPTGEQVVQIVPAPAVRAPVALRANGFQPMLVSHSYQRLNNNASTATNPAAVRPSLDWMAQVQLAPLPSALTAEELTFEAPARLRPDQIDQNLFRSRLPVRDATTEKAAYQFQR
jgi:hypothetical protein